jgi:hypothetical protein
MVLNTLLITPTLKWMIENSLRRVILKQKLDETKEDVRSTASDESNKRRDVRRHFQND